MKRSWITDSVIVCAAILGGFLLSQRPWKVYREQKAETVREVKEMQASEKERADLLREQSHAQSTIGREEMARRLGYVKPGQVPADRQ